MPDPENPQGSGPENSGQNTSVVNADGTFAENWAEKYPEGDRPTLSRFKKFDDFVTSHMSLRRKFNKDPDSLVELPSETSTDEERAEFHRRRGVPDTFEGYEYKRGEGLSDNIDIDDEKVAAFSQIAKKHNLTQEQFTGVANDYLALIDKDITAFDLIQKDKDDKEAGEAESALKKEWGNAYDEKVARANLLMKKYAGQEAVAELGLQNSTKMVQLFDAIAEDMSEDRLKGLTPVSTSTPSEVTKKIAELKAHPAFMDASHPQHQEVVDELTELYKKKSA